MSAADPPRRRSAVAAHHHGEQSAESVSDGTGHGDPPFRRAGPGKIKKASSGMREEASLVHSASIIFQENLQELAPFSISLRLPRLRWACPSAAPDESIRY
jgi:hypothetical protein